MNQVQYSIMRAHTCEAAVYHDGASAIYYYCCCNHSDSHTLHHYLSLSSTHTAPIGGLSIVSVRVVRGSVIVVIAVVVVGSDSRQRRRCHRSDLVEVVFRGHLQGVSADLGE